MKINFAKYNNKVKYKIYALKDGKKSLLTQGEYDDDKTIEVDYEGDIIVKIIHTKDHFFARYFSTLRYTHAVHIFRRDAARQFSLYRSLNTLINHEYLFTNVPCDAELNFSIDAVHGERLLCFEMLPTDYAVVKKYYFALFFSWGMLIVLAAAIFAPIIYFTGNY